MFYWKIVLSGGVLNSFNFSMLFTATFVKNRLGFGVACGFADESSKTHRDDCWTHSYV